MAAHVDRADLVRARHVQSAPVREQPDASLDDVAARLAAAVGRLNRRILPTGDGMSHGLIAALSTIVQQGPLRPGDLARVEVVAAPSMTRALADLEGRGLISRTPDPDDGRSMLIESTPAGQTALIRARVERAKKVSALLAELSDEQVAGIAAALDGLEAAASITPAPPVRPE